MKEKYAVFECGWLSGEPFNEMIDVFDTKEEAIEFIGKTTHNHYTTGYYIQTLMCH